MLESRVRISRKLELNNVAMHTDKKILYCLSIKTYKLFSQKI